MFLGPALQTLMREEFRGRDGAAYAPWSVYESVDPDSAVVFAGSDVGASLLPNVVDRTLDILSRSATSDALDAVVPDLVAQAMQSNEDPYNTSALAFRAAAEHLRGREPLSAEQIRDELAGVDAGAVRLVAQEMRSSLLLGVDGEATWADQMPSLLMPTRTEAFAGTSYRSRNFPASRERLVVSDAGVAVGSRAEWAGIARDDVAAVMAYPDGAREVVGTDGWSLRVEPTMWRRGGAAASEVDALVNDDRRLAASPREHEWIPQPMSPLTQVKSMWGSLPRRHEIGIVLLLLGVLGLFGLVWWWTGAFPWTGAVIFLIAAVGAAISQRGQGHARGEQT